MTAPATAIWHDYDYAVIRVVPKVHLCTFVNVGVVLHARTARFLGARFHLDADELARRCPEVDLDLVRRFVRAYEQVSRGGAEAGPIGVLPPSERFHWLTAPRSSVVQPSHVHSGRSHDPQGTLETLFREYVAGRR